jgi:tetratricopeptide (TPR) repeat protein
MNSLQFNVEFLAVCIQMYPKSTFFLELRGSLYGFLGKYEEGLADFNAAIQLAPNEVELLYSRAAMLRLVKHIDLNEVVVAYNRFLKRTPVDHRKVPEAYYAAASCYLANTGLANHFELAKTYYEKGIEAEKCQLTCFLPYESNNKLLLSKLLSFQSTSLDAGPTESLIIAQKPKSRLSDPRRFDMIHSHREAIAEKRKFLPTQKFVTSTNKPRVYQQSPVSLIGLKAISLREMNPTKDHVHEGYVLSSLIFEQSPVVEPSIWLLFEDDNGDLERLFIYNTPASEGWQLVKHTYIHGTKISILNPYMRMATDNKPAIRVDDVSSIILHGDAHNVKNMCRCCSEANASRFCGKCKIAHYCSKECQTIDWKQLDHKLICN